MKRTKRLLALFLSLMLLAALAVPASADYDYAANAKIFHTDYTGKTVILHTNDVHGAIEGYAYIPALRARLEAAGAEVFVVDGGDYSQGSAYVSASKGASAVALMNEAGYDVVALGNHEFDYGYAVLKKNMEAADFKVVCADVYQEETGETIFDPTALIETKGGLKLGFFGMETPETASKVNPPMIKGISFASFDDLYASAQIAVNSLKEQGADLIIGLTHLGVDDESAENGYRSLDLYDKVPDIDFLIDAHSHTVMTGGENGEPIQSTGTGLKYIGVVVIDNETKTVADNFLMETAGLEKDEKTAAAVKAVIDAVDAEYGEVFAESQVVLNGVRDPNRSEETNPGASVPPAAWTSMRAFRPSGLTTAAASVLPSKRALSPNGISRACFLSEIPLPWFLSMVRSCWRCLRRPLPLRRSQWAVSRRPAEWSGRSIPPFPMIRVNCTSSTARRAVTMPRPPSSASASSLWAVSHLIRTVSMLLLPTTSVLPAETPTMRSTAHTARALASIPASQWTRHSSAMLKKPSAA